MVHIQFMYCMYGCKNVSTIVNSLLSHLSFFLRVEIAPMIHPTKNFLSGSGHDWACFSVTHSFTHDLFTHIFLSDSFTVCSEGRKDGGRESERVSE